MRMNDFLLLTLRGSVCYRTSVHFRGQQGPLYEPPPEADVYENRAYRFRLQFNTQLANAAAADAAPAATATAPE